MNKQKILPSPAGLNHSVRQVISNLKTLKAASFNLHRSTFNVQPSTLTLKLYSHPSPLQHAKPSATFSRMEHTELLTQRAQRNVNGERMNG